MRSTRQNGNGRRNSVGGDPVLQWVNEVQNSYRFRYESEMTKGSHGCLRSSSSTPNNKAFPKVQLLNCTKEAYVLVKLMTHDHEDHVHKLIHYTKDGPKVSRSVHLDMSNTNDETFELQNIGIWCAGKAILDTFCHKVVTERRSLSGDTLKEAIRNYKKDIQNVAVLRIEALDAAGNQICAPLYSSKIEHQKTAFRPADLNIEYVSRVSGFSKGEDEVIILCKKMQNDKIKVRFFETAANSDHRVWEKFAKILHFHYLVAIRFKTPRYHDTDLKEKVDVKFELYRESDDATSNALTFTYIPDESEQRIHPDPATDVAYRTNLSNDISGTPPMDNLDYSVEDNSLFGIIPLSPGIPDPLPIDMAVFDFGTVELDSVPKIRPAEIQTHAERVSHATANSGSDIPKWISDVQQKNASGAAAALPEVGTGLAYRLALSTARALHEFARTGDVRFLLASMRHLIAVQDEHGDNAIHSSVIHTQEEALHNLVEVARTVADYDILNMYNEIKQTPLHIAVYTQQTKVIEVLLYHGANPNLTDSNGNTPVHMAAQQCSAASLQCLEALLDTNNYAAKYESHVPDLNAYNFAGFTPLHMAVMAGSELIVRCLCAKGCDVDRLDRTNGRSALHLAIEKNHLPIIRLLLEEAGADADISMFNGNTPLHLACSQDQVESVSLLIQSHADPYLENLEMADVGASDVELSSSGGSDQEEIESRGLTSLDLARSEQVRRLLRGELDPASVKIKTEVLAPAQEFAAPVTAIQQAEKSEKKPSVFDSGIGLSETNLSLAGDAEDKDVSNLHVTDILDDQTLQRLSKWLDCGDKWKQVANVADMSYLISTLESVPKKSPSLAIMSYTKPDKFQEALEKLHFLEELRVFKKARGDVSIDQLGKQVKKMNL